MTSEPERLWLARLQALGKTQARYLWFLVIASVFYLTLWSNAFQGPMPRDVLKVPLIELELSVEAVLEAGGIVLSFLVMVVMGALRAYRSASEQLGSAGVADNRGEAMDTDPNFLDLAFYTTSSSRPLIRKVVYFKYPLFLSLVLAEAASLLWTFVDTTSFRRVALTSLGAILWLTAGGQVVELWYRRFKNAGRA